MGDDRDKFLVLKLKQIEDTTITFDLTVRGDEYMHYYNDVKMGLGYTFTFWDSQPTDFDSLSLDHVKIPRSITDNLKVDFDEEEV